MDDINETLSRSCRFLSEEHFRKLYEAFMEAFADYVVPFALTETQFRNHINLNAVDLERTAGYFEGDKLVGFSLNGFGKWNGKPTVYDAGTGVIPAFRRQGVSNAMFKLMMPKFKNEGIEQWLLEVVTTNTKAINLYNKLGFQVVRELALLQCDKQIPMSVTRSDEVEIREIYEPDWQLLRTFWDSEPSWQNSIPAVERSRHMKRIFVAYRNERCVGYIVFSSKFGRVSQFAVHKHHRNQGIGTALIVAMQTDVAKGFSPQIINLDRSLTGTMKFFLNCGFYETISQYEMTMQL